MVSYKVVSSRAARLIFTYCALTAETELLLGGVLRLLTHGNG